MAHVISLVGQLSLKPGGPWKKHYDGQGLSRGAALHLWLFNLGPSEMLAVPSGKTETFKAAFQKIQVDVSSFNELRSDLTSKRNKAARSGHTESIDAQLEQLYRGVLQPFDWSLLGKRSMPNADRTLDLSTGRRAAHRVEQVRLRIDVKRGLYFGVCEDADDERRLRPRVEYKFLCTDTPALVIGSVLPATAQDEVLLSLLPPSELPPACNPEPYLNLPALV